MMWRTSKGRLSKAAMHLRRKTPSTDDGSALSGLADASSPTVVLLLARHNCSSRREGRDQEHMR